MNLNLLYLAGHDFTVDAADVDTGIKTSLVVSINYVTAESLLSTSCAVVRSL